MVALPFEVPAARGAGTGGLAVGQTGGDSMLLAKIFPGFHAHPDLAGIPGLFNLLIIGIDHHPDRRVQFLLQVQPNVQVRQFPVDHNPCGGRGLRLGTGLQHLPEIGNRLLRIEFLVVQRPLEEGVRLVVPRALHRDGRDAAAQHHRDHGNNGAFPKPLPSQQSVEESNGAKQECAEPRPAEQDIPPRVRLRKLRQQIRSAVPAGGDIFGVDNFAFPAVDYRGLHSGVSEQYNRSSALDCLKCMKPKGLTENT